jgi:hypothetical protein
LLAEDLARFEAHAVVVNAQVSSFPTVNLAFACQELFHTSKKIGLGKYWIFKAQTPQLSVGFGL